MNDHDTIATELDAMRHIPRALDMPHDAVVADFRQFAVECQGA